MEAASTPHAPNAAVIRECGYYQTIAYGHTWCHCRQEALAHVQDSCSCAVPIMRFMPANR